MGRRAAAVLIALLALLAFGPSAGAAEYLVTTTEDGQEPCTVERCTVRAALQAAQANRIDPPPHTIKVPPGNYVLTAGSLYTGTTMWISIVGAGADVTTIRGNGKDRLLEIGGESSVTIEDITFADGTANNPDDIGGNIVSRGASLSLLRVRVTNGTAANGGGVAAQSSELTIANSLIDGNRVTDTGSGVGGGVLAMQDTSLLVTDSTITGNTAREGGGLANYDDQSAAGAFSLNAARGGGGLARYRYAGSTTLTRVTLAGNTSTNSPHGALASFTGEPAKLSGTIVARNLGQTTPRGPIVPSSCSSAQQVDAGGNLADTDDCGFTPPDSRQGVANLGLETQLRMDGGTTQVLPINATSPARDFAGACTGTDQRGVTRPSGAACDAGAYEFVAPVVQAQPTPTPTASPAPPSATPTPAPTPVRGRLVVAEPTGTILVRIPPSKRFVRLTAGQAIPMGAEVDAKRGRVVITASATDKATFHAGIFRISQSRGLTTLTLTEQLARCPKAKAKRANAAAKKPKKRRLWGDGKGKFRTKGRYSAATVRGTKWLVEDTCAGTLTRVTQGSVTVRDGVRKKNVIVKKGKRYLARPKR